MKWKTSLYLCFAFATAACGSRVPDAGPRIYNGVTATSKDTQLSSTVALTDEVISPIGRAFCSGVLVKRNVVLTAAHCVTQRSRDFFVTFGTRVQGAERAQIAEVRTHPAARSPNAYIYESDNDLALLVLTKDAPASIPFASIFSGDIADGQSIILSGFGRAVAANNGETTGTLRYTKMIVRRQGHKEGALLLQGNNTGSCPGDSGGPAFVEIGGQLKLIGIDSLGTCGDAAPVATYVDVRHFRSWLTSELARL